MYRYASVTADDHYITDRGGRIGIQPSHGVHNVSGRLGLFVSLSFSMVVHSS